MFSTTSAKNIEALRTIFARYGIPADVVSDNRPQFTSIEFRTFLLRNGIRQTLIPAHHAASNGAAERLFKA